MPEFMFIAKKVVAQLAMPPMSLLVLAILALLTLRRWPRLSRGALWFSVLALLALSTPAISRALARAISTPPGSAQELAHAEAIVVLGGGQGRAREIGPVLSTASFERVRYGAALARRTHLPVLVSGGVVSDGPAEAQLMAATMRDHFQIEPRWIEDRSRNTHENALFSVAILKKANVHTIALVTSGTHERRALAEFRAAGLVAVSMPSSEVGDEALWLPDRLPDARALHQSAEAIHEMLGAVFATP